MKNVGRSAADTGRELLISSLKGEDVKPGLKRRIDLGKKKSSE